MIKKKCEICGKEIEGYNFNHVDYLLQQHKLTHRDVKGGENADKENKTEEGNN